MNNQSYSPFLADTVFHLFSPDLAKAIGLNEAIFIQHLQYRMDYKKKARMKKIKNMYWVYNTYDDWHKEHPYWSVPTIRRIVKNLEEMGVILSEEINAHKADRTKWYTINYGKLNELYNTLNNYPNDDESGSGIGDVDNSTNGKGASDQIDQTICSKRSDPIYNDTKNTTKNTDRDDVDNFSKKSFPRSKSESLKGLFLKDFSDPADYSYDINEIFYDKDKNLNDILADDINYLSSRSASYNYINKLVKKLALKNPDMTFPNEKAFIKYMVKALADDKNNLALPEFQDIHYTPKCLLEHKRAYMKKEGYDE